jgi:uncharacterized protein involved in response to NO
MPAVAWFAFVVIQCAAVLRIGAEVVHDPGAWQALAALAWVLALLPWAVRIGRIVSVPRIDGGSG